MMEKLRPALKQIFWICTGFVVLLSVSSWWLAVGSLRDQIEKDKSKLNTAQTDSKSGADAPNSVYTSGAKQLNKQHLDNFEFAEQDLHERQIKYRTYPQTIASELPASFGAPIPETALRRQYSKLYNAHFAEQLRVLDPFIVQDNKGLIDVLVDNITHEYVEKWHYVPPTASEIWNAQEDLWLLRSLFESIAAVNEGSERLARSPVRQLTRLALRGGARVPAGTSMSGSFGGGFGATGFNSSDDDGDEDFADFTSGNTGVGSGRGTINRSRSTAGQQFQGNFANDLLTEEFGPDSSRNNGSGAFGGRGFNASDDDGDEDFGEMSQVGGGFGGGGAAPAGGAVAGNGRYVDDAAEYRTRAFLIHVKVESEYIPALLAELTNSSFPVEIVRVNAQFTNQGGSRSAGRGRPRGSMGGIGDGDEDFGSSALGSSNTSRPSRMNLMGGRRGATLGPRGGRSAFGGGDEDFGGVGTAGAAGFLASLANEEYNPNLENKGYAQLNVAIGDPALAELMIGGLLTVYRTKEENEAVKELTNEENEAVEQNAQIQSQDAPGSEELSQPDAGEVPAESVEATKSTEEKEDTSAGGKAPGISDSDLPTNEELAGKTSEEPGEEADNTVE